MSIIEESIQERAAKWDAEENPYSDVSEDGRRVSEEIYWDWYYDYPDFSYEWNDGVLEEKPVSDYLSFLVYLWFTTILEQFLSVHPIGKMVGLGFGFRMEFPDKVTIRKPDLGVLSSKNQVDLDLYDRSYGGIFDLCIEVISDSNRRDIKRDTVEKLEEYERAGVLEYYILDRKKTYTAFYRRNSQGKYEPIDPKRESEESVVPNLIRSAVLPGFQFRMDDLYRRPSLKEMAEDGVYQGFVLPFYQEERKKTEAERARADWERKRTEAERARADWEMTRADQEKARADRLAQKLRQLGFPEE